MFTPLRALVMTQDLRMFKSLYWHGGNLSLDDLLTEKEIEKETIKNGNPQTKEEAIYEGV